MAEFQFVVNGELVLYDKYEDIPDEFDHVIKFLYNLFPTNNFSYMLIDVCKFWYV